MRQHKAHGLDDMRCFGKQHFAFCQCFTHQAELVVLQIAQTTMDQLAAGRGRVAGQIVLFAQKNRKAATGGIRCDTDTVDATANNGNVVDL